MGRYTSDPTVATPVSQQTQQYISSNPYQSPYGAPGMQSTGQMLQPGMQQQMPMQQNPMANWPTVFPKPMVSLDLNGTLIEYVKDISGPSQVVPIPGALEAVRELRIKGHKVFILADYPGISKGKQTMQGADGIHQKLMQLLGQVGCFSIDGLLYNTSDQKQDIYAKPNIGMINRAKSEMRIDFSNGYHVGDSIEDMSMAVKAGLKPILVLTGLGKETEKKLDSFVYRDLKPKVQIFPDLMAFVNTL